MSRIPVVIMMTLCLNSGVAQASVQPSANVQAKAGRRTVVGILTVGKDMITKLLLNPASAQRMAIPVENTKSVKNWIDQRGRHSGLVRVELEVPPREAKAAPVRILKITPVRARRVPVYDESLMAIVRGNG